MKEVGADLGGEGSSGGLIDGSFNYCRDSMLAALVIIRSLAERGRRAYEGVRAYHQSRAALRIPRSKASKAIRKMAAKYDKVDMSDGVKVFLPRRAWVLVRPSGTEDIVRVSAEADKAPRADQLVKAFSKRVKELSK
jgi:phosphomannomutase / phosphoglucomutase